MKPVQTVYKGSFRFQLHLMRKKKACHRTSKCLKMAATGRGDTPHEVAWSGLAPASSIRHKLKHIVCFGATYQSDKNDMYF